MDLTEEEFIKTCYYTQYDIVVPLLNRKKVSKVQFIDGKTGKYDFKKEKDYLKQLYNSFKHN